MIKTSTVQKSISPTKLIKFLYLRYLTVFTTVIPDLCNKSWQFLIMPLITSIKFTFVLSGPRPNTTTQY